MREKLLPLIRKMPFETNCKVSIHKRGCCWDVLENFNPIMLFPAIHHNSTSLRQILKFNLISLMYVFEKVCSRHPNYTKKINFHLFHLPYDLIFFHLSGSTSTITHTKYYTSQNVFLMMSTVAFFTPCAFCHCCFFSVYNSAYTERAALETTL